MATSYLTEEQKKALAATANALSAPGKGCTLTLAMPYIWQHDSRLVPA